MTKVRILKGQVMSKNNVIEKWRRIIGEGKLPPDSPQELVAAIQDMGVDADTAVLDPLIKQLSDHAMKFLRSRVGTNHPNCGEDIVLRAQNSLMVALCKPQSSDGKGFRVAYYKRLSFRLKDAIAKETRERRTEDDIVTLKTKNENHRDLAEAKTTPEDDPHIDEDQEDLEDAWIPAPHGNGQAPFAACGRRMASLSHAINIVAADSPPLFGSSPLL